MSPTSFDGILEPARKAEALAASSPKLNQFTRPMLATTPRYCGC